VLEPVCPSCGRPGSHPGPCPACQDSNPPYDTLRSWALFEGPIRNAIHSLKYRRNVALGDVLAGHLAAYVRKLGWQVDLVVPVPLGRQRMNERGYNQAALLAMPVAFMLERRYAPRSIFRIRETRSQVGLSAVERRENIADAFQADPDRVFGKAILLIDDVTTTGATVAACSKALREAGATTIHALTLARALPHHGLQIV
jgi:ComF family protein